MIAAVTAFFVTDFFDQNFSSIVNGLALGMLIFILAIGLSLIFGLLDVLNLAHGSLYLLGTYLGYELVEQQGLPFILAAAIAVVFGIGVGLVLAGCLRPIRGRGHLDQVLLTLGLFFVVADVVTIVWGREFHTITPPGFLLESQVIFGHFYPSYRLAVIVVGVVIAVVAYLVFERTQLGAVLRAAIEDRAMVAALGHNVNAVMLSVLARGGGPGDLRGRDRRSDPAGDPGRRQRSPPPRADRRCCRRAGVDPGSLRRLADHRGDAVARRLLGTAARSAAGGTLRAVRRDGADPDRTTDRALRAVTRSGAAARVAVVALLGAAPLVLGDYRTFLLTEIMIFGLFAASLDVLVGYSGLPSLGHAGYYGVGAYAAGLLAIHVTPNAFAQLTVATAAAAGVALVTGVFAVRSRGVYFLMLTLAFGQLLWVLALNWTSVTGGSNGIFGLPTPTLVTGSNWLASPDHFYWYVIGAFLRRLHGALARRAVALRARARGDSRERGADVVARLQRAALQARRVHARGRNRGIRRRARVPAAEVLFARGDVVRGLGGRDRGDRHRRTSGRSSARILGAAFYYIVRDELSDVLRVALAARPRHRVRPRRLSAAGRPRRRRSSPLATVRAMRPVLELEGVGRRYGELRRSMT